MNLIQVMAYIKLARLDQISFQMRLSKLCSLQAIHVFLWGNMVPEGTRLVNLPYRLKNGSLKTPKDDQLKSKHLNNKWTILL